MERSMEVDPATPRRFQTPLRGGLAQSPFLAQSPPLLEHPSSPARSPARSLGASPRADFSPARSPQFGDVETSPLRSPTQTEVVMTAPEPRLVIHKLVLINFKSYAGRQEIGPFNASFSAVVGPNGSGKSNVIDSLLFVFGFRATKMRQSKLTALIHKSEAHPDLTSARVEVHFEEVIDTPLGTEKILGSEMVVAREVSHGAGSSYYINQRMSSYTEVTTLLKARGIDLTHKRFLILQGEVESIALMKPKADGDGDDGLLEYLEDIIGTSDYKDKIKDTETELEVLKEAVGEKRGRMDIASRDLDQLDNRRRDIEFYMAKHNASALARSALLQRQVRDLSGESAAAEASEQAAAAELAAQQQATAEHAAALAQAAPDLAAAEQTLSAAQANAKATEKRRQTARLAHVKLETQHRQLEAQQRKAAATEQAARRDEALAQTWLANFAGDRTKQADRQAALRASLGTEEAALEKLQTALHAKTQHLSDELEALQREVDPWRVRIQAKNAEMARVRSDADVATARHEEAHAAWTAATAAAQKVADAGQEATAALKHAQESQRSAKATLEQVDTALGGAAQEVAALGQQVAAQRSAVAAARDARSARHSADRMLSALLELKIRGFYGRLGALGSIDGKFDVAVSTACPRLDDFVVDTVETGQRCIAHLRQAKLGSARFILLDQQRPPRPFTPPPGVSRLFDLVTVENPKFSSAFYSVMRDTLVARTAEEARRIALGGRRRHRVVSQQGVLIEPSGTMAGGGEPSRGRMTIRGTAASHTAPVSAETLAELERALASTEMQLAEARSTLQELQDQKRELEASLPALDLAATKQRLALEQLTTQMGDAKARRRAAKQAYEERVAADGPARERAAADLSGLAAAKQALETESQALEHKIAALQDRILAAGGLELRVQSAKVDDLRNEIAAVGDQLARLDDERRRQETLVKRHGAAAADAAAEQAALVAEVERAAAASAELAATEAAEDAAAESAADTLAAAATALDAVKDAAADTQAALDAARSALIEIENRRSGLAKALAAARERLREARGHQQQLQLYDPSEAADLRFAEETERPEFVTYDDEALDELDVAELERTARAAEKELEGRQLDLGVLDEYRKRFAEYAVRRDAVNEVVGQYDALGETARTLKQRRFTEFMAGFTAISDKLKEMYQMITMGGNAELELVDHLDPFAEGILFSVMPPKKSWRNIANLSGGEKTLSSLALVFALHHYKPTPLYVMDEIDAALDFRNVSIVANYIKERTTNGQFIVISLRNNMFELATRLVGIYKVNNMTRSVTLVNPSRNPV